MALNYKALDILRIMNKDEFNNLYDFVKLSGNFEFTDSEIFEGFTKRKRKSESLIAFFETIKDFYPAFSGELTNNYLLSKYRSISNIKKLFAKLEKLCEHYLVMQEIAEDKYYYNEALLYQYQKRGLKKHFYEKYNDIYSKYSSSGDYNIRDYLSRFTAGLLYFMIKSPDINMQRNREIEKVIKLQTEPSFNLLFYFIFDSLKLIVNLIAHINSYKINPDNIEFYELFKKCFPVEKLKDIVDLAVRKAPDSLTKRIIKLYWLNYLFRTTHGKKAGVYFKNYYHLLDTVSKRLNINEKFDLYHEIIFGFWLSTEYPEYEELEFKFYDSYLKNEGFKAAGKEKMVFVEFKNLMIRGDGTRRYKWTTRLIKNHLKDVPDKYHKTLLNLRSANLYFMHYKYEKALGKLFNIKRQHHTITRDILNLYIKIYYDIGEYNRALYYIDSLRMHLSNQKTGKAMMDPFKGFISCTKKLIKNRTEKIDDKTSLINIINKYKIIVSKEWLLRKISQLQSELNTK